ncbi:thaumatin-like protein 1 [Syzygium oleosum]|uniref:thaumatin-like protein 1 n=1 Tax=Syzygium oleosum TaxID=219896 RepID=UPI0011D27C24|nr:thaumatin-like protein 1 [Syzygium oleosum]
MHPVLCSQPSSRSSVRSYICLILLYLCRGISGATFTLINRCDFTVWPGVLANAGSAALGSTGFELPPGTSRSFQAPPTWSGRFWGRTGCSFDPSTSQGSCATGDCGSNQVECNGAGAAPPATLAEFTVQTGGAQDFYDVSLVDGYNLPMLVDASGGSGACLSTGCVTDLNQQCPAELRDGSGQACKSACEAFGSPQYCCSGAYGSPDTCQPSIYSQMFKAACPRSYSYAYDDRTSTFTCTGANYAITFCPSLSASQKSATDGSSNAGTTSGNSSGTTSSGTTDSNQSHPDDNPPWLLGFTIGNSSGTLLSRCDWPWLLSVIVSLSLCSLHS